MKRFSGYIRVSRVGNRSETLISPELQEREINRWKTGREVELRMLEPELDQSGAKDERPILQAEIELIAQGLSDGIVVWNFARFTRSLSSSIYFLEEIEGVGGELHSTSQPLDATTPQGKMTRNFFFSIAQAEREESALGFDKAKANAIEHGIYTAPKVPFGFVKNDDRRLEHHLTEAPARAEAVRRRAAGETWRAIRDFIRETTGREYTMSAVREMIRSPVNIGEQRQSQHVNRKAHPPIIDRPTWEAALIEQPKPPRSSSEPALLGGLLRCAGCSHTMSPSLRNGRRSYACRKYHPPGDCPAAASATEEIEELVVATLFDHARQLAFTASERTLAIDTAATELEQAEAELVLFQETIRVTDVGAEHFGAGMRSRAAAVTAARRALAAAKLAAPNVPPGTLEEIWPRLSVVERRQVLRSSFSVIWVRRGERFAPVAGRVRVIAASVEIPELPSRGRGHGALVGFDWEGDLEGEIRVPSMEDGR